MKAIKRNQFISTTKFIILLLLGVLILAAEANAVDRTWDGGGATNNWSDAVNWSDDTVPGGNDKAIFDATSTKDCSIDTDISVSQIEINSGYAGTISQGISNITVKSAYVQADGNFAGGSGTFDFQSTFEVSGGTFASTTDTASFRNGFTIGSGGTFNHNNGTVRFYSLFGTIDVDSIEQFNDLQYDKTHGSGLTIASNDTLVVNGTLSLLNGIIGGTSGKIQVPGDCVVNSNFDGGNGMIEITGNAVRTITFAAGATLPALILDAPNTTINTSGSGTVTINSDAQIQNISNFTNGSVDFINAKPFTQSGGTITQGSGSWTFNSTFEQSGGNFNGGSGAMDFKSTFEVSGGTFTSTTNTASFINSFTIGSSGTFNHNNGTVRFYSLFGTLDVDSSEEFNNFQYDKTNGSGLSIASNDALIITGTLALNDGNLSGLAGSKVQLQGDLNVNANFDGGNANISFEGNAVQTLTDNGGGKPNGTWTLNKSGGTVNLATNFDLTNTSNDFNFTSGTITTNGFTFNLGNKNVTSGGGYVIGNLQRSYTSVGAKTFDVGTANGYSPIDANVTALNTNPSSLTISAIQGTHPNSPSPANSLGRYWNLTETGDLAAILTFHYLDADVPGTVTESDLELKRYTGTGMMFDTIPATINPTANAITTDNSITDFSDWTAFKLAPTAAVVDVGGRVLTEKGRGIPRAFISITDQNGNIRSMMTNPFGFYRFRNIEVGQIYAISVSHKSYQFMDPTRVIMINDAISDLNFTAQNIVSTKGSVSIEGRISDVKGNGIGGIKLKLSGGSLIKPVYAETDKQGRYVFEEIKVGNTYILTPQSKRFIFSEPTKIIYLEDFLSGVDFKIE